MENVQEEIEGEDEDGGDHGLRELFMVGVSDITINQELESILEYMKPGSMGLRMKFTSKEYYNEFVEEFCTTLHEKVPGVLISLDHEGGMIQNFTPPDFSLIPPMRTIGERNNKKDAYSIGEVMSRELNAVGCDWVFGPVVDVTTCKDYYYRPFGRCFSDDQEVCGDMGNEMIKAIQDNGMISCIKHYPNMGGSKLDSHRVRPDIDCSLEEFQKIHLHPFKRAVEVGVMSMMTNHARYPNIDDSTCATFSKIINIEFLREKLGFEGVLLTDDLGMGGVYNGEKLDPTTVCYKAIMGGCDVCMYSFDVSRAKTAYDGLLKRIKEEGDEELLKRVRQSVERVRRMKEIHQQNRRKKEGKRFPLDVLHCEKHTEVVKRVGYSFGVGDREKEKKKEMTVGMDCSKIKKEPSSNEKEEEEEEEEGWWWCNIL